MVARHPAGLRNHSAPRTGSHRAQKHTAVLSMGFHLQLSQPGSEALSFLPPPDPVLVERLLKPIGLKIRLGSWRLIHPELFPCLRHGFLALSVLSLWSPISPLSLPFNPEGGTEDRWGWKKHWSQKPSGGNMPP